MSCVIWGKIGCEIFKKMLRKNLEVMKKCLPLQSQTKNGVHETSGLEQKSSLKRLIYCTRSKYREKTIYREALILLKGIISVGIKLET